MFLVKTCLDCNDLQDAICAVDGALAAYGKQGYQNTSFLTNKQVPYVQVKTLIYYREILDNLMWDQTFYAPFTMTQIVSRARAVAGTISHLPRGIQLPTFTTTTSTTTTSTTTSSTTTTTTTHTTTTTSSTTTSSTTSTTTSTTTTSSTTTTTTT